LTAWLNDILKECSLLHSLLTEIRALFLLYLFVIDSKILLELSG